MYKFIDNFWTNTFLLVAVIFYFDVNDLSSYEPYGHQTDWINRIEGAAAAGQFIGQDKDYIQLGAFIGSKCHSEVFCFTDVQGYWLEGNRYAANLGFGARRLIGCNQRTIGANIYYDFFQEHHATFNRLGIGLESLGQRLDFRINGYLPLNASASISTKEIEYQAGYGATRKHKAYAYKGVDAEVGYQIYKNCDFSLYCALGPYFYQSDDWPKIYGGQCRIELRFFECLSIEGLFSDDNYYHANAQVKFSFSIPFDFMSCCPSITEPCNDYYTKNVKRNGLPFFKRCCDWKWNW